MYYEPMVDKPPGKTGPFICPPYSRSIAVARHLSFGRAARGARRHGDSHLEDGKTARVRNWGCGYSAGRRAALRSASQALSSSGTLGPALEQIRQSVGGCQRYVRQALRHSAHQHVVRRICVPDRQEPADLSRALSGVELEVSLDNTLTDIVAAGFDAGIRLGHALHRDMVAVPLGPLQRRLVVASPALSRSASRRRRSPKT